MPHMQKVSGVNWRPVMSGLMIAAVTILVAATTAQAVTITHDTLGTMFEDDFENVDYLGLPPCNASLPGTWYTEAPGSSQILVIDEDAPGAYEGSQYLSLYDGGTCNTHAKLSDSSITSGKLHIEYMAYVPEEDTYAVFNLTQDGSGNGLNGALLWVLTKPETATTGYVGSYDGTDVTDTGIDWTVGVWQKWELDVDLDAGNFTVSVDGSTSGSIDLWRPGNIAKDFVFRGGKTGETFYVDAVVPEPSVFVLMAGGLIGLLIARRRR